MIEETDDPYQPTLRVAQLSAMWLSFLEQCNVSSDELLCIAGIIAATGARAKRLTEEETLKWIAGTGKYIQVAPPGTAEDYAKRGDN